MAWLLQHTWKTVGDTILLQVFGIQALTERPTAISNINGHHGFEKSLRDQKHAKNPVTEGRLGNFLRN